ncbi:MAG TPA: hypothetical protein VM142_11445 [Acidimicrobiales bacterium]|nr:hypothetical protein [Acidimicrobiales bacterium]
MSSAYNEAGSRELHALRSADPELVEQEAVMLGSALRRVLDQLSDGARVLMVGHSPTNEAVVFGARRGERRFGAPGSR